MKQRLQLDRSRLLGFRLSLGADQQASNDVRVGAKIGKFPTAPMTAAQARAYFDARMGAKSGKVPAAKARAYFEVCIGAKIGKIQQQLR